MSNDDATLPLRQVPGAGNVTRVVYSGTVPARPTNAVYVDWVGDVDPALHAVDGDSWLNTADG